jgi:hypothetical protein
MKKELLLLGEELVVYNHDTSKELEKFIAHSTFPTGFEMQ